MIKSPHTFWGLEDACAAEGELAGGSGVGVGCWAWRGWDEGRRCTAQGLASDGLCRVGGRTEHFTKNLDETSGPAGLATGVSDGERQTHTVTRHTHTPLFSAPHARQGRGRPGGFSPPQAQVCRLVCALTRLIVVQIAQRCRRDKVRAQRHSQFQQRQLGRPISPAARARHQ